MAYSKLAASGAIHTAFKAKTTPIETDFAILIDAAFQIAMSEGHQMHYPSKFTLGRETSILYQEYLAELKNRGFDESMVLEKASELKVAYCENVSIRKAKAAAFFKLIQTEWIVEDHEVKKYIDSQSIYDLLELVLDHVDSTRARLKAIKMHAADPKQADKVSVREWWNTWQDKPEIYKGKAAFARAMLDKFPNLESQPVIESWCRAWERET